MPSWFKNSGIRREQIVRTQKKQIIGVYRNLYFEVRNIVGDSSVMVGLMVPNVIKKVYYGSMERSVGDVVKSNLSQIEPLIKKNMEEAANAVIDDNFEMLYDVGFGDADLEELEDAREERVSRIISMVVSGSLYDKKWNLPSFVDGEYNKIMSDLRKIISKCLDLEMSQDEIVENIELYFNPDREKKPKFFVMFPGVKRKIVSDSVRTGNTMVGHSYEETFVNVTKENPFIEAYRWVTSGSDRVCPVCIDRESTDKFGLGVGIFPKDQLPLDHPNGMCTFDPVYVMPTGEIIREIDLWKNGGSGTMKDRIDRWVKTFSKK